MGYCKQEEAKVCIFNDNKNLISKCKIQSGQLKFRKLALIKSLKATLPSYIWVRYTHKLQWSKEGRQRDPSDCSIEFNIETLNKKRIIEKQRIQIRGRFGKLTNEWWWCSRWRCWSLKIWEWERNQESVSGRDNPCACHNRTWSSCHWFSPQHSSSPPLARRLIRTKTGVRYKRKKKMIDMIYVNT